jgi:photosystem II stability/assembly factor-like uncharacterized protein
MAHMKKQRVQFIVGTELLLLSFHLIKAQWVQTNGPEGGMVNVLTVSGSNIFAGTSSGVVFRTTNNGQSWTAINSGLTNTNVLSIAVSGSNIFIGTWGSGVFLSDNNGSTWKAMDSGLDNSANSTVRALAANGNKMFAGTDGGLYYSANNGKGWTKTNSTFWNPFVHSLAKIGNSIFAGYGMDFGSSGCICLSTDNGTTWTVADSGLLGVGNVTSFAVCGSTIFASSDSKYYQGSLYQGGVFRSTNSGTSWTAVDSGLPVYPSIQALAPSVQALAVIGSTIFAAAMGYGSTTGYSGVFYSTNNGTSWNKFDSGLVGQYITSLAVSGTDLFAGTTGGGVWRRPLSDATGINSQKLQEEKQKQTAFNLTIPTKSNHRLAINYSLFNSEPVSIKIYNLSGREIITIVNKNSGSGLHSFYWDTRNIATGCYTVRMQAGAATYVKSVPIVR